MNKITLALALGTGLTLGLTSPSARASTIQTLSTPTLSATTFNDMYQPYNTAILSPFRFAGSNTDSGLIESQVFQGKAGTSAAGTFAYAYQIAVNPGSASATIPNHVDSTSFLYNATPLGSDLTGAGKTSYGYVITSGQVGGLNLPGTQAPTSLSWQADPQTGTGVIRAQFVDPTTQAQALAAGGNSATLVLISNQLPNSTNPTVNVGGAAATTTVPVAYSVSPGSVQPIPVPEPATLFAWAGMVGAFAVARRVRKHRQAVQS